MNELKTVSVRVSHATYKIIRNLAHDLDIKQYEVVEAGIDIFVKDLTRKEKRRMKRKK